MGKQFLTLHVNDALRDSHRRDAAVVVDGDDFESAEALGARLLELAADGCPRLLLLTNDQVVDLGAQIDANPLLDFLVKPVTQEVLDLRLSKLTATVRAMDEQQRALERVQAQADRLAYYDRVTNLPNAEFFTRHLSFQLHQAQRYGRQLAVLAVDLQSFERVRGLLGEEGVGALLNTAGQRIVRELRDYDVVGQADNVVAITDERMVTRIEGDKFLVLLSEVSRLNHVTAIVERLIEAVAEPIEIQSSQIVPKPRVGISMFPSDGEDAESLICHAHSALECARDHGVGRYGFFAEAMNQRMAERFSLESRLRKAIAGRAFELVYQPKVSLTDGSTAGLEALLRWRDPDLGTVSPAKFVPLAEELGLINDLSRWVVQEVCAQSRRWQQAGVPPLSVSVNLSGQDFLRSDFPDFVTNVLLEHEVAPQMLELEITEGVLIENLSTAAAMLEELRRIGVSIALDDFGTGYSSLGYLHRIPIDTLKIDRSFIRNITTDWNSAAITSGVITLSHILNLNVVAEGVETREQLELLKDQNCNEVQGSIYSMPLKPDAVARWLRASTAR